jgi:uncharacterized protein (DUF362 family)
MKDISRRDFLKFLGAGTLGIVTKQGVPFNETKAGPQASDVIQCFDENATSGGIVNSTVAQIMVDESIKTLTGISDVGEAWKSIFPGITQNSTITIKVNCINSSVPTRPELVDCIINGLALMDFSGQNFHKNNVIIWDRTNGELSSSGYTHYTGSDPNTPRCFGTNESGVGYDGSCPLNVTGSTTYPSRIMSILSDYLINVGVLKNHGTSQVTLSLKNHYGSVSPVPSHSGYCSPAIPSLNQQIRDVITPNDMQRIFIIDVLWASVVNGPSGNPDWNPKKILMSLDTVACDYRGWQVINEERQGSGYSPVNWPIYHIQTASQSPYNLGTTDINLIEINNPSSISEHRNKIPVYGIVGVNPNPVHTHAAITVSLSSSSQVLIDLVDTSGRIITPIYNGYRKSGTHTIHYRLNGTICTGTYFMRCRTNGATTVQKVMIVR